MSVNNEWRYVKPLKEPGLIAEFERRERYSFPDDFKTFAADHNGGRPPKESNRFYSFYGERRTERVFKKLLSFNKDDPESIWKIHGWQREWDKTGGLDRYVAFAIDPGGNMICFDKTDGKVVYINLNYDELSKMPETVADSFTEFVESLFAREG